METDNTKETAKLTYTKPRLRTIELAAEEVLAIGCKVYAGGFFDVGNPFCGIDQSCSGSGS